MTTDQSTSLSSGSSRQSRGVGDSPNRPLIMLNDDASSLHYVEPPHTEQALMTALQHLINTQVGAICWCLGEDVALAWPSKVLENYYDQLARGFCVHDDTDGFTGMMQGKAGYQDLPAGEEPGNLMLSLHRRGVDYLPKLIELAREKGIRFYGSFRMNDCHLKSSPKGMFASAFWQGHQQFRLWEVQDGRTYYNAAMDYSFPEVRNRRLAAMRETLDWYDMDGIELDFCRNPFVFQPSEAWEKREILTDFIRQVRADLDAAGQRRGRKMDLILRIPFDPKKQREAGMDVDAWLDQRLINVLVMSCLLNDYNQPLEPWLTRCRDAGVAFYPSIEQGPVHNAIHNHLTIETIEETVSRQRSAAQNFIGQGAAGVYMFNYPCILFQVKRTRKEFAELTSVLSEMGSQETLVGKFKQYAFWKNLPMQVESRRPAKFHQTISFNLFDSDLEQADTRVAISFRQVPEPNPHVDARHFEKPSGILPDGWITYILNGKQVPDEWIRREAQAAGAVSSGFKLGVHEKITITPPSSAMRNGESTLGFFVPRFPEEKDPYVMIYELLVDVNSPGAI